MSEDLETAAAADVQDPSSSSNRLEAVVKHVQWKLEADFDAKVLHCSAILSGSLLVDGCSKLILDINDLKVTSVSRTETGEPLEYEVVVPPKDTWKSFLKISGPSSTTQKGSLFSVTICYDTTPSCAAVQWLEPAQTAGKKQPYLYTQCQPIHARSMLPCMDTPAVKFTYSAEVTSPACLTALMSAERKGSKVIPGRDVVVTEFEQKVPIPSYLLALVVGALESRSVGPRSKVWCEREMIDQAEWDLSETDKVLCAAEELAGPYLWGVYDVLVLPPSFPYGGMENPCLTFVSPTILSASIEEGDKSASIRMVAHEVSHSWTGNLVTNLSWEHFWLNEGWTTYLERKIIARLFGEQERHLRYIIGWKSLQGAIAQFKKRNQLPLTAMVTDLADTHPDDAYSVIPYEKGAVFLFYLENLLGGPGSMDAFIKHYLATYKFAILDSSTWKQHFLDYFKKEASEGLFDGVEWDKWFYSPDLPPHAPRYDTTLADASNALAEKWNSVTVEQVNQRTMPEFSSEDLEKMSFLAQIEFLNKLKVPLSVEVLEAMDSVYNLSKKQNTEMKYRWLRMCLQTGQTHVFPVVAEFITTQGRMKYTRGLYRDLYESGEEGRALALRTFSSHRLFYHTTARSQIEIDLKLRSPN